MPAGATDTAAAEPAGIAAITPGAAGDAITTSTTATGTREQQAGVAAVTTRPSGATYADSAGPPEPAAAE